LGLGFRVDGLVKGLGLELRVLGVLGMLTRAGAILYR